MAGPRGSASAPLVDHLLATPHQFDFFQALRLLQLCAESDGARIGHDAQPAAEVVRLRGWAASQFPPADICRLQTVNRGADDPAWPPYEMTVSLPGLYGPQGVLPPHYTQRIVAEVRHHHRQPLRDFLDLFNHRLWSLLYRAWEKYRLPVQFERFRKRRKESAAANDAPSEHDLLTRCLLAAVGLAGPWLGGRLAVSDDLFVDYSGAFSRFPRNASSLAALLNDTVGLPIEVRQFQGSWLVLAPEDRSALPSARLANGLNNALGKTTIAGERVWSIQHRFRVRIGPVRWPQFQQFVPGAAGLVKLAQVVRQYVGLSLDFDIQVVLARDDVPELKLDASSGEVAGGARLGISTWLLSRRPSCDKDEAVFQHDGFPEPADHPNATPFM